MKKILLIVSVLLPLMIMAQSKKQLQELTVIASRTTNNAEGYIANIAKGKPTADVLSFLPNISCENGNFKINGLAVSEI